MADICTCRMEQSFSDEIHTGDLNPMHNCNAVHCQSPLIKMVKARVGNESLVLVRVAQCGYPENRVRVQVESVIMSISAC